MNKFSIGILLGVFVFAISSIFYPANMEAKKKKKKEESIEIAQKEPVLLGIERLEEYKDLFKGKRVGLITNPTGITRDFRSSIEVLKKEVDLVALFGPEHGVYGNIAAGDYIEESRDPATHLPVFSLYGKTKTPTAKMLEDIDILAIDIQDVGTRYYTYTSTLAYAMQGAKEQGKTFVVFDRPNPLGGMIVEGEVLKPGNESFIGLYPTPVRHGLTIGEWAQYVNQEQKIGCDLVVIPMKNWNRTMVWSDTGLPWVPTSPNIPTFESAFLYPGLGMIGSTGLANGVGTPLPFQLVGTSSGVVAEKVAEELNQLKLDGLYFRPSYFNPRGNSATYAGVQVHITDAHKARPIRAMLHMMDVFYKNKASTIRFFTGEGERKVDIVVGSSSLRLQEPGKWSELIEIWEEEASEFRELSKAYWIYPEKEESKKEK